MVAFRKSFNAGENPKPSRYGEKLDISWPDAFRVIWRKLKIVLGNDQRKT
jgi:hypothetical protein